MPKEMIPNQEDDMIWTSYHSCQNPENSKPTLYHELSHALSYFISNNNISDDSLQVFEKDECSQNFIDFLILKNFLSHILETITEVKKIMLIQLLLK